MKAWLWMGVIEDELRRIERMTTNNANKLVFERYNAKRQYTYSLIPNISLKKCYRNV